SPLYVLQVALEAFPRHYHEGQLLGVLSLIAWSLLIVVTLKYVVLIMRIDHKGEGGVLSLVAAGLSARPTRVRRIVLTTLGVIGAALLLGDGVVTPAISVLSSLENIEHYAPRFERWIVPSTVVVLLGVFLLQRLGTGGISRFFGPIMLVWFLTIGLFGLLAIIGKPGVLVAFDPRYAIAVLTEGGLTPPLVIGGVVLCVTGAEALYTDMGHFGRVPIRIAWLVLVWPSLLLSYFGQGAAILADPSARSHPFISVVPSSLMVPMIILSTIAAVIASQAVITGLFSIGRHAIQMGFLPPLLVKHTSREHEGRIYVPFINKLIGVGAISLVILLGDSQSLAGAYGVAVTALMTVTTIVFLMVVTGRGRYRNLLLAIPGVLFLVVDLGYVTATSMKIISNGWVPLLIAFVAFIVMGTWGQGNRRMMVVGRPISSLARFRKRFRAAGAIRTPGTGIFLSSSVAGVPRYLDQLAQQMHALPERVVLLTFIPMSIPSVPKGVAFTVTQLTDGYWRVRCRIGYLDNIVVQDVVEQLRKHGLEIDADSVVYFLRRWQVLVTGHGPMSAWRARIFAFCYRNAVPPSSTFDMPPDRLVLVNQLIQM
ncbi:MAG: KUP/HAK/KT family potassium transporter, partial [Phycisphaerales bacterium]|nr:KUP/HAK/KT family potassium transporter [Phycisphaerales bacterium]